MHALNSGKYDSLLPRLGSKYNRVGRLCKYAKHGRCSVLLKKEQDLGIILYQYITSMKTRLRFAQYFNIPYKKLCNVFHLTLLRILYWKSGNFCC